MLGQSSALSSLQSCYASRNAAKNAIDFALLAQQRRFLKHLLPLLGSVIVVKVSYFRFGPRRLIFHQRPRTVNSHIADGFLCSAISRHCCAIPSYLFFKAGAIERSASRSHSAAFFSYISARESVRQRDSRSGCSLRNLVWSPDAGRGEGCHRAIPGFSRPKISLLLSGIQRMG